MKKNNKGLTLVELIVAFAILGFVIIMVGGFITTGANTYGTVAADVNLQYEAQLTMSQIQEYVIDCTGSAFLENDTLYFMKKNADGSNDVYRLRWDAGGKKIYLGVYEPGAGDFEDALMSNYATGFNIDLGIKAGPAEADPSYVETAVITIDYALRNKTYTGSQTIALRNAVTLAAGPDEVSAAASP